MLKELDLYRSYLSLIEKAPGTEMFQSFYMKEDDKHQDILEGGEKSCAFFVSSILKICNLLSEIHTTVPGLKNSLEAEGWLQVNLLDMKAGDVLIWEWNGQLGHVGFALDHQMAVSNNSEAKTPIKHRWDFNGKREAVTIFRWKDF